MYKKSSGFQPKVIISLLFNKGTMDSTKVIATHYRRLYEKIPIPPDSSERRG